MLLLNVKGVKKMLTYMATFGMNQAMMYTEDTYEVERLSLFRLFKREIQ